MTEHPIAGGAADRSESAVAPAVHPPCSLTTAVFPDGDRVRVEVRGELALDTSEQFRTTLRKALSRSAGGVDLDLTDVAFCDCSALNVLLNLRQRAAEQAKTVVIRSAGSAVARLLTATDTRKLFACPGPDAEEDAEADAEHPSARRAGAPEGSPEQDLRIEVAQMRRAMQTRPTIDLARGILMASFRLSSDEAWSVLVTASQNTNTKLHRLAGDLVTAVKGDALSEAVQEQLSSAVAKIRPSPVAAQGRGPAGGDERNTQTPAS